jgi:hypothetical protein
MEFFVDKDSVVREIWSKGDTILFIFAGAAAEFALNKAVDWLYFTGRLPADPIGRLFSTVNYSKRIVFSEKQAAFQVIDRMRDIHSGVEKNRGSRIPDWAYRDVLFMLIHYSIASFELLERKLSNLEKEEVLQVFLKMGNRMGISGLPADFQGWLELREQQLQEDLFKSHYTIDLYAQYKRQLGNIRYRLLKQGQSLVVPKRVSVLLNLSSFSLLRPVVSLYKFSRILKIDWMIKALILPKQYRSEIKGLDMKTVNA